MQSPAQGTAVASSRASNGPRSASIKPLTVEEALPYSPFSSIVPFGPDPVPVPTIQPAELPSIFSNATQQHGARQMLEQLDRAAENVNVGSNLAVEAVQSITQLLNPQSLSRFKFKAQPGLGQGQTQSDQPSAGNGLQNSNLALGTFSEMVLNSADFIYRYPTPKTPGTSSDKQDYGDQLHIGEASKPLQSGQAQGRKQLSHVELGPRHLLTPENTDARPAVLVPEFSPSRRKEYEVFATPSSAAENHVTNDSKKHDDAHSRLPGVGVHNFQQSEKSEAALRRLSRLMVDIFEAENQLPADTSDPVPANASEFFTSAEVADGTTYVLVATLQLELESAIAKVLSFGRFQEVPFEYVARTLKLCEGALRAAESLDARLPDTSSEIELDSWLRKASILDLGLKSARTLLTITNGGREEKQIYSEETLQSVLQLLKAVCEAVMIPVIELRSSGSGSDMFQALGQHKQAVMVLFSNTVKILQLFTDLVGSEGLTERAVTTIEFLTISLIFIENAHNEKDSVLGVQKGERLRIVAMDLLVQIFSRYKDHQAFIFDEVLMSLEKLPVTRQRARQYRLADGKSIQLVSALILRLVQSSPTVSMAASRSEKYERRLSANETVALDEIVESDRTPTEGLADPVRLAPDLDGAMKQLSHFSQPLVDAAQNSAHYVVQFLVSRALKSSKTGDDPYRVLLDIFVEDFLAVLESTDWPASATVLRFLLTSLMGLAGGEKSAAPAKNMALDVLGMMGAALSDIVSRLRRICKGLEASHSGIDAQLFVLGERYLSGELQETDLLSSSGPYALVLDHIGVRPPADGVIRTVRKFHIVQWASRLCSISEEAAEQANDKSLTRLANNLTAMIAEDAELDTRHDEGVSPSQALTAYTLVILTTPFGKAFERILIMLLNSMNSDQATVRSKGLKSVIHLIEKDPTILDRGSYVLRHVINRTADPSPLVRDSALGLLAKCLTLRPTLDEKVLDSILARAADAQVGVRKRSMKILRDMYRRKPSADVRTLIADALLHRMTDADEGVSELARQLLEEIWISSLLSSAEGGPDSTHWRLAVKEQASLIVKTVQRGGNVPNVLGVFLESILGEQSKNSAANLKLCKSLVDTLFDEIIDNGDASEKVTRQAIMQTLTVFAKANAALFRAEQLEHLQIYVEHLSQNDDLTVFRSVVVIFRLVLPHTTSVKTQVLAAVQKALLESLTRLGKRELNEVVACLWTINGVLQTTERLSKVTISCIKAILSSKGVNFALPENKRLVTSMVRYMNIAGLFGKYCDFENDISRYRTEFPWWKGESVPSLLIDIFAPLTKPTQPLTIRTSALDGIGAVCQAWPWLYFKEQVTTAFDIVFTEGNPELEHLVLTGLKDYLTLEEKRSDTALGAPNPSNLKSESRKLGVAFVANRNDGVATSLAQRYLKQVVRIALSGNDTYALNATEVIASINRQGLVHPKECVSALVALETSKNPAISKIAFREHRTLHQKHETIVEKEYTKAVQQAFDYQRSVAAEWRGATQRPLTSKLQPAFEVIKSSKPKMRKKFLGTLCSRIDFDPAKLDVTDDIPLHLQFATFVAENLAFFDYSSSEEVIHVIACLERLVSTTGTPVAHALETEVFKRVPMEGASLPPETASDNLIPSLDPSRSRQLTVSAVILTIAWETRTFLSRLYGLSSNVKQESKSKGSAKESSRPLTKHQGVNGQVLWDANEQRIAALTQSESMLAQCKHFVDLMSLDHELKLAAEKGDLPGQERRGSTSDEDSSMMTSPRHPDGSDRKRKGGKTGARQNAKRQRRPSSTKAGTPSFATEDEELI